LRQGLTLVDGPTRPAQVKRIRDSAKYTFFEITITEGRNRQVRRMVEALGAKVLKLVRTAIGDMEIGPLEIGKYRALTAEERTALGGMSKKPSRPAHPATRPQRPQDAETEAQRRSGKSARWVGGNRRRGHNESARKP
jgi:hypothetical protein